MRISLIMALVLAGNGWVLAVGPPKVVVVAHRGMLQHAPENTAAAFRTCLNLRIGFEVDVQRSSDGELVCIHDNTVDRTTDGHGRVDSLTVKQLQSLDAGSWFGPKFARERILTFDQLLALVKAAPHAGAGAIAVDLKASGVEGDVVRAAERHGVLDRLLFIGSAIRDRQVRTRLREANSQCHVACLANTREQLQSALEDGSSNWVYFRYIPSLEECERAHEAGKRAFIAGPTVSGLERRNWTRAAYAGIDAILTDHPIELAALLRLSSHRSQETPGPASATFAADTLSYGQPADVKMEASLLADAVSLVKRSVADDELRGAVLLVARRGKIVLHTALGYGDADRKQPLQKDALFRMASNTKAVTAAGILKLVESGLVGLDDPVHEYLPAFDTPRARRITLRQLLTHTSGMRIESLFLEPLTPPSDQHPDAPNLVLEASRFGAVGAEVQPGASYSYNNAGYNTLAAVIESITGSYADHLRTTIYEPLGMTNSCNHESVADHSRMSTVFRRQKAGGWEVRWQPGDEPDIPFPRGSGGMISSAYDYAVFCQMLLNQGMYNGQRILDSDLVRQATNPQVSYIPAAERYGLGWAVSEEGGKFSHSGSDGTWAWVDPRREIVGLVLTQTQTRNNTTPRAAFRELVNRACLDVPAEIGRQAGAATTAEGFYKDIFMSGGTSLSSRRQLFAADSAGLSYEYYAGSDTLRQNKLLIGTPDDENGVLLYPDGQPRFRMLYVNGGGATLHGKSLTEDGREALREFNTNGGSYCGSCAGSFFSGRNVDRRTEPREAYLHIFPFNTRNTGLKKTRLGHAIPANSPLLQYRKFGADRFVEDIYHNNGNWLSLEDSSRFPNTEILATYDHPDHKTHGGAAIWAYKKDDVAGRVVNIGSHPEGVASGERLALTEACFLYALDGVGRPKVKGTLVNGEARTMSRRASDNEPALARIGDRQLHHFRFTVTDETPFVRIELQGEPGADLNLFLHRDAPAFRRNATHRSVAPGGDETLNAELEPGDWYAAVECATTVKVINDPDSGFYRYYGNTGVLNGFAYTIKMSQSQARSGD